MITIRNQYQIYNLKQHVESIKLRKKYWRGKNSTKMRKPKIEEKLGRK